MHICSHCGKKIKNTVPFCPFCGAKQPKSKFNRDSDKHQYRNEVGNFIHSYKKALWVIIAVFILLIGGFGLYKYHESHDLSDVLTSHSWNVENTGSGQTVNAADGHKFIFKHGKVYVTQQNDAMGKYNVKSQHELNLYSNGNHMYYYYHVKKFDGDKVVINSENVRMPKKDAAKLKKISDEQHAPMSPDEKKLLTGQKVHVHITTKFTK